MKRILITGDDGYQSIGTRLVIRALQGKYNLTVVATKSQMSSVGGHINLKSGFSWGEDVVDGIHAYWVDGYPADAMEFVAGNMAPFDYIISGMNLGANIGPGFPSGTVSAAVHGVALHIAPKAIILSLHVGRNHQLHIHDGNESLDAFMPYPFNSLTSLLAKVFANDLWGAPIININFPEEETHRARITTMLDNLQTFYNYPIDNDVIAHRCSYGPKPMPSDPHHAATEETGALMRHVISITPFRKNSFFEEVYTAIPKKEIPL